jgi:uncharacterized protein YcsI (UPF0317 family)
MSGSRGNDLGPARALRLRCRTGEFTGPTCGLAPGFVQANLVVLPRELAFHFLLFCERNPKPCPLLEVTDAGEYEPRRIAPGADVRTDLPRYFVYRHGELVGKCTDIRSLWRDDLVAFLIGCSFTFEGALLRGGLPVRHLEEGRTVPMYRTNIPTTPAGPFHGPLVVSMRPFRPAEAIRAIEVTSRYPQVHGAPVHLGDPAEIGIADLARPDWGEAVTVRVGELPVFWACGVTPQAVAQASRPEIMITHAPGHMFISDLREEDLQTGC